MTAEIIPLKRKMTPTEAVIAMMDELKKERPRDRSLVQDLANLTFLVECGAVLAGTSLAKRSANGPPKYQEDPLKWVFYRLFERTEEVMFRAINDYPKTQSLPSKPKKKKKRKKSRR